MAAMADGTCIWVHVSIPFLPAPTFRLSRCLPRIPNLTHHQPHQNPHRPSHRSRHPLTIQPELGDGPSRRRHHERHLGGSPDIRIPGRAALRGLPQRQQLERAAWQESCLRLPTGLLRRLCHESGWCVGVA